ncbi:MAG: Undecaprenyl-phosphate mannosyltransferase [Parcubacteria group bacterium ADurb.Bin159]|nr:MAG: Undecaprenyl-phosphate mannosyltransferase [Parcubacteria group bacterium ADurb.Bin159]
MTKNKNLPRVTQPNLVTPFACNNKTIILVIPAYNEEKTIGEVISNVKNYADFVVVVDDGSKDRTSEIAEKEGAIVYRHCINLGLGASLITGFKIALKLKGDIIVTFDADGQHCPFDIEKVIAPILDEKAEVVIGTRTKKGGNMPFSRKIYNYIANILTFFLYGNWVSDSQSGLRAFKASALEKLILSSQRMEISSEIVGQIKKQHLKLVEVPISAIYTSYSLSKGQNFKEGLKTAWALFLDKFL